MEYFFGERFDKGRLLASPYSEYFFTSDGTSVLKNGIIMTHNPTTGTFAHASSDSLEGVANIKKSISERLVESRQFHKGSEALAEAVAFLRRCLRLHSTERATASDLLKDPWLVGAGPLTAGHYPPHYMHSVLADMSNRNRGVRQEDSCA